MNSRRWATIPTGGENVAEKKERGAKKKAGQAKKARTPASPTPKDSFDVK
ncbi:hypothetical protein kuro4_20970 [Gelria sp. Kuro-4]|jgi:hypothetical protein|nr:hypothetical protein kuro4_20970 [Gelria sp. Kuro-4]